MPPYTTEVVNPHYKLDIIFPLYIDNAFLIVTIIPLILSQQKMKGAVGIDLVL